MGRWLSIEKSMRNQFYSKFIPNSMENKSEFILPLDSEEDDAEFVLQLKLRNLEVYDISSENSILIKRIDFRTSCMPYYLSKSSKFLCRSDRGVRVYNSLSHFYLRVKRYNREYRGDQYCYRKMLNRAEH